MASAPTPASPSAEAGARGVSGALLLALALLSPVIVLVVGVLGAIIVRQRRALAALRAEAEADALTGLPNRRGLARHWQRMEGGRDLLMVEQRHMADDLAVGRVMHGDAVAAVAVQPLAIDVAQAVEWVVV